MNVLFQWVCKSWLSETFLPSSQVSAFQASRWRSLRYVIHTATCGKSSPKITDGSWCWTWRSPPVGVFLLCLLGLAEVNSYGATCGRTLVLFAQVRLTHWVKVTSPWPHSSELSVKRSSYSVIWPFYLIFQRLFFFLPSGRSISFSCTYFRNNSKTI